MIIFYLALNKVPPVLTECYICPCYGMPWVLFQRALDFAFDVRDVLIIELPVVGLNKLCKYCYSVVFSYHSELCIWLRNLRFEV